MNFKFIYSVVIISLCVFMSAFALEKNANASSVDASVKLTDPAALINNEIVMLDNLIAVTEKSLEKQKALRDLIEHYNNTQKALLKNSDNKELLFRTVKLAQRVLESIQDNHLTHNFDSAFLSELTLLSQIAAKYGEPKP